ncbi:hypothetical protein KAFR_0D01720 [Kazachstania africana CBS 2517]|uniref:Squalene monooxygenase n=1 Tax=Kazachstania africana (strain ATCC 22294 / BCRC 22015 / CBS 2517 / CECT 1963 / NBRC 1671 / NRRL Y-8276) TaxID=1071382 RepID=H2ATW9_KAZAF|nr:hypothetical protein KAFR_0D01720 [Kazachstania africana CBS 2517]CCF57819.1 hypothetical protein KAFR_0D01720 [Kazachstania africana CBS 2517]
MSNTDLFNADERKVYDAVIIGAGVIGPCIATALARKGKKVLIVERDWAEPDRIIGELMHPGGIRALRSLGMVQAINNIDAIPVTGYTVFYNGEKVDIPYPYKADLEPVEKLKDLVKDGNDQVLEDATIHRKDFEDGERERGAAFVHGKFLTNLRNMVAKESNITRLQGNVIEVLRNEKREVIGCKVDIENRGKVDFKGHLTFVVDGIFSHFRKELRDDHIPAKDSSFVGMALYHAKMPTPNHGHVILGPQHSPVICYQVSPEETRILCAYNSTTLPKDLKSWMAKDVQPYIPESLRPSFDTALAAGKFRSLPNSYLPAKINDVMGLCVIGDALNMRHPLGGGGMTVGLQDVVLLIKKIGDLDFSDRTTILDELLDLHYDRKSYAPVINVLSIALYALFAADSDNLRDLQRGCFRYFQRGGDCVDTPIKYLAGVNPHPYQLTRTFFAVALYTIYLKFEERGFLGLPVALLEGIMILITAVKVFTPYLLGEIMG